MTDFPVDWVDAFTHLPMGGNGCAVVHGAGALDAETCMRFVRETSLVECTFLEPSEVADWKVRYFLANREIPFAGHPTIASAASLHARGLLAGDGLSFETGAGLISVEMSEGPSGPWFTMTQAPPVFGQTFEPSEVAALFGLRAEDIVGAPQLVSTGIGFIVTIVKSLDVLKSALLDANALEAFGVRHGGGEGGLLEPYLVALEGVAGGDTFARLLLAPPLPPEDPFTGSATGCTAAYLWKHGLIGTRSYMAEQGHGMGRPGQARVEILGPPGDPTTVRVGGQAHVLMSGQLHLG